MAPVFLFCNRHSASRASALARRDCRASDPCRRERTRGNRRPLETTASFSNPPGLCRRKPRSSLPALFPNRASYPGRVERAVCLSLSLSRLGVMLDDLVVFGAAVGAPNTNAQTRGHTLHFLASLSSFPARHGLCSANAPVAEKARCRHAAYPSFRLLAPNAPN